MLGGGLVDDEHWGGSVVLDDSTLAEVRSRQLHSLGKWEQAAVSKSSLQPLRPCCSLVFTFVLNHFATEQPPVLGRSGCSEK